ncbi:MAG: efflux RND transporter periplasmic adaptor subunit [Planctomycetes bacterium]|nr:efflux RND transporter periplasmic adaptor subunit [Planctomycetota bacterium]
MRYYLLGIPILLLAACGDMGGDKGKWGSGEEPERKDPLVEVVPTRRDNIAQFERSTGRIDARIVADVYVQITETVTELLVDVGDNVQAGQPLARLNRERQELTVASTLITVQEAELAHRKNELDAEKRQSEFARIQKYFDPNNPEKSLLYSKEAYEAAKLEYDKAMNQVETSRLALDKAQGELAANQLLLAHTVLKAPINGVITERNIRGNELAQSNSLAFKIADLSVLEVRLDVPESSLQDLREPMRVPSVSLMGLREKVLLDSAQSVLMSVTAFPNARFIGYVDRISPTVDQARGMIVVTVRIIQPRDLTADAVAPLLDQLDPNARKAVLGTMEQAKDGPRLALRPGMWVDARVSTQVKRDVMLVPGAAIVGDSETIWVIDSKEGEDTGVARRVDIARRRGISSEGSFELLPMGKDDPKNQEVKDGALIVVRGQSLLRDGQKVRVRDLTR